MFLDCIYELPKPEQSVQKGAPPSPPQRSKTVKSCMNSHKRLSHRTSKFSSNRHRKLQPFRET
ncbi:uncharacterized protein LOC119669569 isoform X2 [Teleopsis dalmanni]|uniref:uncharacterized protein LOC119669569 isoform X2 n=1 Tax=Teleopsis dalmanni TaxID=139649 RepID=UPI0018CCB47B|nr:uncharacterized protein LOC119669569 isoform X2 [Teleopsis dalmanni]